MTLSEFVKSGTVGTRAQRAAFEHGLVVAQARALEVCGPPPGDCWGIDADVDPALWATVFEFAQRLLGDQMT